MTKVRVEVDEENKFGCEEDARRFMLKVVEAGIVFISCDPVKNEYKKVVSFKVKINNISQFQTTEEARIRIKRYLEAGIIYINVEKGWLD